MFKAIFLFLIFMTVNLLGASEGHERNVDTWSVEDTTYHVRSCQQSQNRLFYLESFMKQQSCDIPTLSQPIYGDDEMAVPSIYSILAGKKHNYCFIVIATQGTSSANADEKIVAAIQGSVLKEQGTLSFSGRDRWWQLGSGYISDIVVLPKYQVRHGIGKHLISAILNEFKGLVPRVFLENKGDIKARDLYLKKKFRQAYNDGGELWVLSLDTHLKQEQLKNKFMEAEERLHTEKQWSLREKQEILREEAQELIEGLSYTPNEVSVPLLERIAKFCDKVNSIYIDDTSKKESDDIDKDEISALKKEFNSALRRMKQITPSMQLSFAARSIIQNSKAYSAEKLKNEIQTFLEMLSEEENSQSLSDAEIPTL